jgi:hypothetical protein
MSSPADRQRAHRRRERDGRAILPIEVNLFALSDALVTSGFLEEWNSDDRDEIRAALQRMIETLARMSRVTE